jgi:hypothetical protein
LAVWGRGAQEQERRRAGRSCKPSRTALSPQKSGYIDSRLAENRAKRSFCHISTVTRERDFLSALRMTPDLMAAGAGAVELEAKRSQPAGNFTIGESSQASH